MKEAFDVHADASPLGAQQAFSRYARDVFSTCYPETPHKLRHSLAGRPLVAFDAIAELGESLPAGSVDCNLGDAPIGAESERGVGRPPIGEAIRGLEHSSGWAVLRNIGQHPAYSELLAAVIDELRPDIERRTGRMSVIEACLFITNLETVTPHHSDPRHLLLMQIAGSKKLTQFAPGETGEDDRADGATVWNIRPGDAVFVPVMAPHRIKGAAGPAISLSFTWRSKWSQAEADARAFNALLRSRGLKPASTNRWPAGNAGKALLWKLFRPFV